MASGGKFLRFVVEMAGKRDRVRTSPLPELLTALDAFMQEHRRCGEMDGGLDGGRVRMACDCGAIVAHLLQQKDWA